MLQEFASEPLKLIPPPPDELIMDALKVAGLVAGHELEQRQPRWVVEVEDPQALVTEVGADGLFRQIGSFFAVVGGAAVQVPQVQYSADSVVAELVLLGGQPQALLADANGGDVRMSVRRV
jgi:hypothetical protein